MVIPLGVKLEVSIDKKQYLPGETVKATMRLNASQPKKARALKIALLGEEWVRVSCGSGKSRRRKNEAIPLHKKEIIIGKEKEYSSMIRNFEFEIPKEALPTIQPYMTKKETATGRSNGAGLRWYVKATLDIPLSLDVNGIANFEVR